MSDIRAQLHLAIAARERGDFAEALRLNQLIHSAPHPDHPEERNFRIFALLEWGFLIQEHAPARLALQALRQREAAQLDTHTEQRVRFILELNLTLGDHEATLTLFRHLEARAPALARRVFHNAADELLACGALDVLQRHLPEPQEDMRYRAGYLNSTANERSLPRRLGEALAFVSTLRLQCGVLVLQGKAAEVEALKAMALDLVEAPEARDLVLRELEQPGTISDLLADWHASRRQATPSDFTQ
jgi:hypothetical protein